MSNHDQIARAFSAHQFNETYEHLAPDIRWSLVGGPTIEGRDAVIAACRDSTAEFAGVSTDFTRFISVVADTSVAIDAVGRYTDVEGGVSVVSSCDIYEFDGELLTAITSYAVELPG